ncbi:MAG TPA: PAS domain-containing protein [Caulobacteraceae bacterium]|nr:PAS domain-containing protein [Caulobacteraceae bacterium]
MSVEMGAPASALRAHEELFAYWASRRKGGRLPGRADIDPAGIKRLLPSICLVDVLSMPRVYRVRLAGTGLYGVFGGEVTGKRLPEIYDPAAAAYWRRELDEIVDGRRPGVGCHSLAWRGATHVSVLWMRLPLAANGRDVDMILGYDAVLRPPGGGAGVQAA